MKKAKIIIVATILFVCTSLSSCSSPSKEQNISSTSNSTSRPSQSPQVNAPHSASTTQSPSRSSSEEKDEPPMNFGGGTPGRPMRSTEMVGLSRDKDQIVYKINYPNHGLESVAVLGFRSRALREETFDKKWKIVYAYAGEWTETYQLPAAYTIYGYASDTGKYDRLINKYSLVEVKPNIAVYRDTSGKTKVIEQTYLIILHQP